VTAQAAGLIPKRAPRVVSVVMMALTLVIMAGPSHVLQPARVSASAADGAVFLCIRRRSAEV
jgi:hypothetical protein